MKSVKVSKADKLKTLRLNPYFADLPKDVLTSIVPHMQLREYERSDILFWDGDPCSGLHIIESGSLKLYRVSPVGRQYIIAVITEGATCNEVPAFDGGTNPVNVEALEISLVWVIASQILRDLVLSNPEFALKILGKFGQNLRQLVGKVSEMAFYQVTHRLARLINNEMQENELRSYWTQEQLASRLGTVREVVARSLKELEKSGAIQVKERHIHIKNREILRQWTHQ